VSARGWEEDESKTEVDDGSKPLSKLAEGRQAQLIVGDRTESRRVGGEVDDGG
jgi:hypothetical protein